MHFVEMSMMLKEFISEIGGRYVHDIVIPLGYISPLLQWIDLVAISAIFTRETTSLISCLFCLHCACQKKGLLERKVFNPCGGEWGGGVRIFFLLG